MEIVPQMPESAEPFTSKINLYFLRHEQAEGLPDAFARDQARHLTPAAVERMIAKSPTIANRRLAKAIGSIRVRSQMTAALLMEGQAPDFEKGAPTTILGKVKNGILGTPRLGTDARLDLNEDGPMRHEIEKAYLGKREDGKKLLQYEIEDSDEDAIRLNDSKGATYSRMAAGIASIIKEYYAASDRWNSIVNAEKTRTHPKGIEPELERFFGSHQAITECFLAKVIDKTHGREMRDKFVQALGGGSGFDLAEGFEVEILNANGAKRMEINYSKYDDEGKLRFDFSQEITPELLEDIIREGSH